MALANCQKQGKKVKSVQTDNSAKLGENVLSRIYTMMTPCKNNLEGC